MIGQPSLESELSSAERELVGLKTGSLSSADSANWHKMILDLGSMPIILDYSERRIAYDIMVDAPSKQGTLFICPIVSPALQYQKMVMGGGVYVTEQFEIYGTCALDFVDQRKITVYAEVRGLGATEVRNIRNLFLTIYSNYSLEVISNTVRELSFM